MQVSYLQHVPFEGLGSIGAWLKDAGARVKGCRLFAGEKLPEVGTFEWLIVMGGPMSVNDESLHPWLVAEKELIGKAIRARKVVLGICLGAQLIAASLGARVIPNGQKEIGWFPVEPVEGGAGSPFSVILSRPVDVFHWHGETFELPEGSVPLARSRACRNQAFSIGDRVVALQFHPEMTLQGAAALIQHGGNELEPAPWVQPGEEILRDPVRFDQGNVLMERILDRLKKS